LEELKDKADERGWFLISVVAANVGELYGAVEESSGVQTETLLFPVEGIEDAISVGQLVLLLKDRTNEPDDFFD
jgi:hypothetical protein